MTLEGTDITPDVPKATIQIQLEDTTVKELSRVHAIIQTCIDRGILNLRNGSAVLHFDDEGELRGVDKNVSSYREGKPVINRVAIFTKATVEIIA